MIYSEEFETHLCYDFCLKFSGIDCHDMWNFLHSDCQNVRNGADHDWDKKNYNTQAGYNMVRCTHLTMKKMKIKILDS